MYNNRNSLWASLPPITKNLIAINFICWLADIVLSRRIGIPMSGIFGLNYLFSSGFHIWQPFTYMFMHAGFDHIFFNMFALLMFGAPLEQHWGGKRFLTYYLITGIGAGIVQELVWFGMFGPIDTMHITIGASGAIFGILLAFGWLFPDVKMFLLFIPIPIRARVFVTIYAICELWLGLAPSSGDNVAHFAHLGGMLFGWLLILWWKHKGIDGFGGSFFSKSHSDINERIKGWWQKQKNKHKKNSSHRYSDYHYQEPTRNTSHGKDNDKEDIDRILDKIKLSGYDSLTPEEKQRLFDRK
ncbi:MAG: rhomboid family intramembrane serine protease [Paludibacter sp.]|nr:rhomboid family intramembrane serine protease [Bacteroidales bacterium]MCM1068440.1 rhomboid family intramembrane serine protease [Prevotella sp.]MCM1353394.1 rhomboid family intramembrane serine protease [Bacteroides sp.]MCM1442555.1 rhomboid family intramembrane serine protease [Muribaculum sp.]MCM1481400.1 rhomboid family intramembrane serine protease [Paludibacter sp.]